MKKFSYGLIIFLILPIIIILSFPNDPISDSTLFTFETENDELLNGTIYLQGLALPILNGEVSVNNSYLYYLDVSDNQLKLKGVISAELEKNDLSLTFNLDLDGNSSYYSKIPILINSSDFDIEVFDYFRFASSTIKYRYEEECNWVQSNRLEEAIEILEEKTVLNFRETSGEPELYIHCYEGQRKTEDGLKLGEGSPLFYENISNTLINSSIDLYSKRKAVHCLNYPVTEIHEILHALNFGHINDSNSIMHPGMEGELCPELDEEVINCLETIYSNGKSGCSELTFILN